METTYHVSQSFDLFNDKKTRFNGVTSKAFVTTSKEEAIEEYKRLTNALTKMYGDDIKVTELPWKNGHKMWMGVCKTHNHQHNVSIHTYEEGWEFGEDED